MTKALLLASVSLLVLRPFAFDNEAPALVMNGEAPAMKDGKFVYRDKAGAETLVAPDEIFIARSTITARNGEAQRHRTEKEAAIARLAEFEGIDPVKAREAFELLSKVDQKKLIDVGEVDKVRNEIKSSFDGQITTLTERATAAENRVAQMFRANAFNRSKFVAERLIIPADMVEATFGGNLAFDKDGKFTPKYSSGETIYTRDPAKAGQVADFDEALEILVNGYANRDKILKGANNQGTGNNGGGGNNGQKKTYTRDAFEKLPPHEQAKVAKEIRAGNAAMSD